MVYEHVNDLNEWVREGGVPGLRVFLMYVILAVINWKVVQKTTEMRAKICTR